MWGKPDGKAAKDALNKRRPLVCRFSLKKNQWDYFSDFFDKGENKSKSIMRKMIRPEGKSGYEEPGDASHAVSLVGYEEDPLSSLFLNSLGTGTCLLFLNSWGRNWGDKGYFRIQDVNVLPKFEIFDVVQYQDEGVYQDEDLI